MPATVVVGYVPKPEGEAALQRAVDEAVLRQARLVVVCSHPSDAEPERVARADADLAAARERLSAAGIDHEIRTNLEGMDAADELVDLAGELRADLLVIGMRRRSPVGKLILGTQAQRILLDAGCPVLAVKPTLPDSRDSSAGGVTPA